MHILIVHQYYLGKNDAGGSRWNQFAKYWSQAGHKVTVLAGTVHYATGEKAPEYRGKFIVREQETENIEVIRCHVSPSYNKSFLGRFWAYLSFAFSSVWAGLFCASKCDVVICTSPPLTVGLTGWLLSKLKRIPMVFEVRDLWPESAISTGVLTNKWMIRLGYWLERLSYRNSAWINVLTPAFEEHLVNIKNVRREIISMIPNGADLDLIKPGPKKNWVREKHGLEGKFVVTYVGAHGVANHLIQLLQAARLLQEQKNVQFILVGDGMKKAALKEEAVRDNLTNVLFVDSVPKNVIVDYITASDVCTAVLKKVDTFKTVYPNKVFDYMAAKRPVIIGIDGVARKLIEDAGAGVYVEPENADDFAEAVLKLKKDSKLRKRFGENGLKFVSEHFSRDVLANKYMDILTKEVMPKKKSRGQFFKRVFDLLMSVVSAILLLPVLLFIIIAIRLTSKGQAIFKQERAGKNGKPFVFYKFRTMRADADPFGASPKSGEDARLTKVGKFLREYSLDELPQLFNIIKGDMSIVGPRPLYVSQISEWNERQKQRLMVKPGLTGLAQVSGRGELTREEKLELDVKYVETRSFVFDLRIIMATFVQVLGRASIYEKRYSEKDYTRK